MKKILVLAFAFSFQCLACTSGDDDLSPNGSNNGSNSGGNTSGVTGDWVVTYFWDKDKEETSKFSGYSFEFNDDGSLVATKGSSSFSGTWSKNSSSTRFTISISGSDALDEMTDDWLLDEQTGSSIKLRDDNDEHLEEIYLEKQ